MRRFSLLVVLPLAAATCNHNTKPDSDADRETPQQIIARQAARIDRLKRDLAERDGQVRHLRRQLATAQGLADFADAAVRVEKVILGRYSHVADFDKAKPGPDGIKVYLYLYDRDREKIKRAGRIECKAFDLASERKLGHWIFDPRQALEHWKTGLLLNCYVLQLPWQEEPGEDLEAATLRWQFDALTGERFTGTQQLHVTTRRSP